MDEQIHLVDDQLFWLWRRDNPRLAQGVSVDAFKDIARFVASEAIAASAERLRVWAAEIGQ